MTSNKFSAVLGVLAEEENVILPFKSEKLEEAQFFLNQYLI